MDETTTPTRFTMKDNLAVFFSIGLLIALTLLPSFLGQSIYYPLRLYFSGAHGKDTVVSNTESFVSTGRMVVVANNICGKSQHTYQFVGGGEGAFIKKGQEIDVLISDNVKKGIILNNSNPTFFNVLSRYATNPVLAITILVFISVYLCFCGWILLKGVKIILIMAKEKLQPTDTNFIIGVSYLKSLVPFLAIISFSFYIEFFIFKATFAVKESSELVTGYVVFALATLAILFPYSLIRLKRRLNGKSKIVRSFVVPASTLLSIYGFITTMSFMLHNDINNYRTLTSLLLALWKDMAKHILPT